MRLRRLILRNGESSEDNKANRKSRHSGEGLAGECRFHCEAPITHDIPVRARVLPKICSS